MQITCNNQNSILINIRNGLKNRTYWSDDIMYATQFSRVKAKDKPNTGLKNSNFIKKR